MIYLPSAPTAASVKGFWTVVLLLWLGLAGAVYYLLLPHLAVLAVCFLAVAGVCAVAWGKPTMLQTAYTVCSGTIRKRIVPAARQWVLAAVFLTVILPNRIFGRRMTGTSFVQSDGGWKEKEISNLVGGSEAADIVEGEVGDASWLSMLCRWIRKTKNGWAFALLPYMLILSVLNVREESAHSEETYTLF